VKAPVGHQKNFALPCGISETADVWQQFLCPGDIEISARQHEITLRVYFPENVVPRNHGLVPQFPL
jgi:hypothetical protein